MRAARFHQFGNPSVLRIEEAPWPYPSHDELLIHVHASSVNGTDLGLRSGRGPFTYLTRRPFTPGFDVAGVIVRCGPRVTAFETGEAVIALLGHGGGGAAEYVTVRQDCVARAPISVPLTHTVALLLAGLTALQGLRGGAALGNHHTRRPRVLMRGASGGIGSFAVQLARHYAAHITGTARDAEHAHPGIYPESNEPQAWSASSVVIMVQALLRMFPVAPLGTLVVDPHLPELLPHWKLEGVRVGHARVDIEAWRTKQGETRYKANVREGQLRVVRQPPLLSGASSGERLRSGLRSLL